MVLMVLADAATSATSIPQSVANRLSCACLVFVQGALAGSAELNSSIPTSKLCKALLRCFDNRTESCRDMAVSSCSRLLQVDPDATLGLLPYVLPVLVERLQCDEVGAHRGFLVQHCVSGMRVEGNPCLCQPMQQPVQQPQGPLAHANDCTLVSCRSSAAACPSDFGPAVLCCCVTC